MSILEKVIPILVIENLECRTDCFFIRYMSKFNMGFACLICLLFYWNLKYR